MGGMSMPPPLSTPELSQSLFPRASGVITATHTHQQAPGRLLIASMDWPHMSRLAKLTLRPFQSSHHAMAL